jgi:N-methylhydantoinase A
VSDRAGPVAVGIDIGGTFTDLLAVTAEGRVRARKLLTTPGDPLQAIRAGVTTLLAEIGAEGGEVDTLVHGTTIATNAILERRGARCGLLTTRGFRDVLEFRRLRVPALYDLAWRKPKPLVPRRLRREVDERIAASGEILRPLDPGEVQRVVADLVAAGAESLAVCLINSYANPQHERRIGALLRQAFPDLAVSLSAEILPEVQEYERTSTTVVNAYVMPLVRRYLAAMSGGLEALGIRSPLLIMQSNGGLLTVRDAMERPVHVVESGPAAGVMAAAHLAGVTGEGKLIAFDMGGTTAKAALVEEGEPRQAAEFEVGGGASSARRLTGGDGYVIRSAVLDLVEVGQGGGSVAWLDSAGGLHVGPHSAGSDPGPCCYDRGGATPTVTDANVLLGYLHPGHLLGGALPICREKAEEAVRAQIAGPLGLEPIDAAWGIHQIATAGMVRGIKAVSIERGRDPREFALLAYGGSGPVHAAGIAEALGLTRVLVPPVPGVFSALGLLVSRVEYHETRTCLGRLDRLDPELVERARDALRERGAARLAASGFSGAEVTFREAADLRYVGQTYELAVPLPPGALGAAGLMALAEAFGVEHELAYGHRGRAGAVELVTLRVTARGVRGHGGPGRPAWMPRADRGGAGPSPGARRAWFGARWGWLEAATLDRGHLTQAARPGPLIVEEYDATTIVPPGWKAFRNEWGCLVLVPGTEASRS